MDATGLFPALNPIPKPHSNPNRKTNPYINTQMQYPTHVQTPTALSRIPGPDPKQYPLNMPIAKVVSSILKNPPLMGVQGALEQLGLETGFFSTDFVEDVLRLSYGAGNEALWFFRWSSRRLGGRKHTPYTWNLIVDLLGADKLFDDMWISVKVMKSEGLLSMETFSSIFGNYAKVGMINEAKMSFEVMDQYGCRRDVVALNCLLSALCRCNQTANAQEYFDQVKEQIKPDADSYALLLEGWEKEGNVDKAKSTFGEMIIHIGWDPSNTSAYNAFLNTLVRSHQEDDALQYLKIMKERNCFPEVDFYSKMLHLLHQRRNTKNAYSLWEFIRQSGIVPDTTIYNTMIAVFCFANQFEYAYRLLDEMVFNESFPNFKTYNTIFEALLTAGKVDEASMIFREMTKNECYPLYANYLLAIKMYFEADDPEMAVTMWKQMIQKGVAPMADIASVLIEGFCNLKRASEALKYTEEAISRGIQVPSETIRKLREVLIKEGKKEIYELLEKKLRSNSSQAK